MASSPKRRKSVSGENTEKDLLYAMMKICTDLDKSHINLTPLKIECCNGSLSSSFSKAFCNTEPYDDRLLIGDVFHYGISILREFVESKKTPNDRKMLFVFNKLMDFVNGDRSLKLSDPLELQSLSERELTLLVVNHLFRKLATSSCYLIDKNGHEHRGNRCVCGKDSCEMTGWYGDTSIGNAEVWHGNIDIIINDDLAVEPLEETPSEQSPLEVKLQASLKTNPQIAAQTIVFSFLQKKRHPEREHFLTPCIGVRRSELFIMLYDSEHDVLLESSTVPLFENEFSCEFSFRAILVCWLTVNYRFFCSGLNEKFKMLKSNFFDIAKEKITVYEKGLQFQNVKTCNFPELKLAIPYVSSFMHDTQKVLIEKYLKLNKSDENGLDVKN